MTEWRTVGYLKTSDRGPLSQHTWRYTLELPRPLADWDVWDYWERPRTEHMASVLKPGMVLYDVGAEFAWLSCVYATMVGPENMVLIEPSTGMWANIQATWERNCLGGPLAAYHGLLGSAVGLVPDANLSLDDGLHGPETAWRWPAASDGALIGKTAYTYLHDNPTGVPSTTLDDLVFRTRKAPRAITIDVEGAELMVLQGAGDVLRSVQPHVWVSIHPDLMARDYGATPGQVHAFMKSVGYRDGIHLGTDHEEHWYYEARP